MDVKDLKVGNWIHTGEFHIKRLQGEHQYEPEWWRYCSMFSPIPLTEEWLEKFGFDSDRYTANIGRFRVGMYKSGIHFMYKNKLGAKGIKIDSVHQLQNLYFALTGEELEIKEEKFNKISKKGLESALKYDINPKLIERYGGGLSDEDVYFATHGTYRLPSGESIFTAKGKREWGKLKGEE